MGALVAHRLGLLAAREGAALAGLCFAAHRGPTDVANFGVDARTDIELLDLLAELSGNPTLLELPLDLLQDIVLPAARADLRLCETYAPDPTDLLDRPVLTLTGDTDRDVSASHARAWAAWTSGPFTQATVPGDHFFVRVHPDAVMGRLTDWMASVNDAHEARAEP
jgi:surfactin synthase thioesterase subunit